MEEIEIVITFNKFWWGLGVALIAFFFCGAW